MDEEFTKIMQNTDPHSQGENSFLIMSIIIIDVKVNYIKLGNDVIASIPEVNRFQFFLVAH